VQADRWRSNDRSVSSSICPRSRPWHSSQTPKCGDGVEVETDDLPVVAGPQEFLLVLVDEALEG